MQSDQELLTQMRSGDRRSFAALYMRYRRGLYAYCLRLAGEDPGAEDAVQETFLKLAAVPPLEPGALKTWLYSVARNEVLMALRRKRGTEDPDGIAGEENPLSLAEESDIRHHVEEALGRLALAYREVILLREFEGMSYAEIAAVTGDSASSVKSRLFKARRALAGILRGVWNDERREQ